ncbi:MULTISPECIES: DUF1294 domain-containing protein [Chryseobacterium]|nr:MULTISPECIES: DUF1294 domain-containing protein [Chryseobacterium]WSO09483.1 DUF1294 domain-containing protein [Chryseobacterium scophthalmum]
MLILTFFGGTVGAILAMMLFRHKVSKKVFCGNLELLF